MSDLRNSILVTIVYYDIFDFPLTAFEVHKYLINPERLATPRSDLKEVPRSDLKELDLGITLGQVRQILDDLISIGGISSKNGFYFLPSRDALYELRIDREKIAVRKWKKFLRIAKWFQAVPYLRAVLASGSLAINNTKNESDFDVLLVVKSGRLYTCRIFLSLMASVFGARRTRYQKIAPDKFCFNHYITDSNLNIKYESLFNAQTYANLKPVLVKDEIFSRFYTENIWLNKYLYNSLRSMVTPRSDLKEVPRFSEWESHSLGTLSDLEELDLGFRSISPNSVLLAVAKLGELFFNSPIGRLVELLAKKYQQKRIKNNPATYESGGRVIFTDNELEFHPRSFEAFAIDKYNKKLKQLGIIPYLEEKDSGLTT